MGLFGPSKKDQEKAVYDLSVRLYHDLVVTVADRLETHGLGDSVAALQRMRYTAARYSNEAQRSVDYQAATRLDADASGWRHFVEERAVRVEADVLADISQHPLISAEAAGADRYGLNYTAVETFQARLKAVSVERWMEICLGVYAVRTQPQAERFGDYGAKLDSLRRRQRSTTTSATKWRGQKLMLGTLPAR